MTNPKPSHVQVVEDPAFAGGQRVDIYMSPEQAAAGDFRDGRSLCREAAEELLRDLIRALATTEPPARRARR